ncbi:Na+/H+ antiporter NhaC family protein [Paraglaciecola sp.]|uniref:Na+/H+ antiporter NhaC family protein n=1 Tax=Paraglaciecola sp. TaxID=1920173 RepID=UPI0030F44000
MIKIEKNTNFKQVLIAISCLLVMVIYGLMIRPLLFAQAPMALEIVFLLASIMVITQLLLLGFTWQSIQNAIVAKLSQAMPTIFLLFAIGLLIGSWIVSGTIPMLVYYALNTVSAEHIYLIAFIVPIFFSMCTGTSWGSIGTIGLVLITVANVINANLGITAGAIIGGAYMGDKLSPLSDTTNIAAMSVNIDLYQHIYSMLFTTLPSALLAVVGFFILDIIYPAQLSFSSSDIDVLQQTLLGISHLFHFNILLLLPPVIILLGAMLKKPALPVLVLSSLISCLLALIFQNFTFDNITQTLYQGFDMDMFSSEHTAALPPNIAVLLERGGLYALNQPIIITILVFTYVGALDCINAMPTLINRLLSDVTKQSTLVASSLIASAATNAMTSSQYANSFINGEAFAKKYDDFGINRKVLSRSLEDTGTMIESLVPWSTTAVFIYATLGVSISDYWHWQLLSLINIPLAFLFVFFGLAQFKETAYSQHPNTK